MVAHVLELRVAVSSPFKLVAGMLHALQISK